MNVTTYTQRTNPTIAATQDYKNGLSCGRLLPIGELTQVIKRTNNHATLRGLADALAEKQGIGGPEFD